jgi:DNA replication ATP-dependent helicase Dna2
LVGDFVHVIGKFETEKRVCIINNDQNFVVVHPDILISATSVADSLTCLRKSILQERVKVTNDTSAPMVYGNLLHNLLQICMSHDNFDTTFMTKEIDTLISTSTESLYAIGESEATAKETLCGSIETLQSWASTFFTQIPKVQSTCMLDRLPYLYLGEQINAAVEIPRGNGKNSPRLAISKVLDIEEHIWSPMYGIKGNIVGLRRLLSFWIFDTNNNN